MNWRVRSEQTLVLSFVFLIVVGTFSLMLPSMALRPLGWIESLFTVTSAVCVTGLAVFDPGTTLTFRGQAILAILIQLGGLGIMTFATFFVLLTEKKVGIFGREITSISFGDRPGTDIYRLIVSIGGLTLLCETVGALLLFLRFRDAMSPGDAAWSAIFHSVSAFCNAGFSLFPDSLIRYANDLLVVLTVAALIILGGLGFSTNLELIHRVKGKKISLTASLAVSATVFLIIAGFLLFWLGSRDNLSVLEALFLSVTPRTAGFETVPCARLSAPALIIICCLMYVGGSPGGTAGGVKTTTLAVVLQKFEAIIAGRERVFAFGRTIGNRTVENGLLIMAAYIMIWIAGSSAIAVLEDASDAETFRIAFETFSALGTVGLSMGITAGLSDGSKLVLCALMLLGRIGPLAALMALAARPRKTPFSYPEEGVVLG